MWARRQGVRRLLGHRGPKKRIEPINRGVSVVLKQAAVLVSVNAALFCPAHSETSRTLLPAATMIATKLCQSPWKVISSKPARSTAGRKTVRPQERKSGPPAARLARGSLRSAQQTLNMARSHQRALDASVHHAGLPAQLSSESASVWRRSGSSSLKSAPLCWNCSVKECGSWKRRRKSR
jgi:hypothetical protein